MNADGTSNLDAAMLQDIHDYMSRLYPQTGVGTKTGNWRNIESEKPQLDESFIRADIEQYNCAEKIQCGGNCRTWFHKSCVKIDRRTKVWARSNCA